MGKVRLLGGGILMAVVVAVVVAGLAQVRTDTTTQSLLPVEDPGLEASLEAARSFGGDPVVILAETDEPRSLLQGDQIERLVGLEGRLAQLPDVAVVYGPGTVLNQVAGQAQNMMAAIAGRRNALRAGAEQRAEKAGLSPAKVKQAGEQAIKAYDVRYGSLLVKALPAGLPTLRNPRFVQAVVFDEDGRSRQQWRFVVPSADAVAIIVRPRESLDQAATERLVEEVEESVDKAGLETSRVTVTGMPVVAAGLGDVLTREIPLLGGIGLVLILACYLLLPWLSPRRARLLPLVATTAAVAGVLAAFGWLDHPLSLGVVAFLPIVLGTGSDFPAYLVRGANRRQVVVTALAAAAGFGALAVSSVPFVRDLGLALASGVVAATGVGLILARRAKPLSPDDAPSPGGDAGEPVRKPSGRNGFATRVGIVGAAIACALGGWIALPGLDVESQPDQLAAGLPALEDVRHAEELVGSAGEVQVLVRGSDVTSPESLAWMREVQEVVVRRFSDRLHPIVSLPSLLSFLGDDPTPAQIRAGLEQLPPYLRGSVMRSDGRQAVLSFGIELEDVEAQRTLLADLRSAIPDPPSGVEADLAGLPVVTSRSYELVSGNRYLDALAGIAAAGLVLLVGLRRRSDALRAVVAAGLATGWGFAGAWLLGVPLTPLTVALGSLATATACEFTILLGAAKASRTVLLGRSVMVAAVAAACGYLALAFSGLAVIRDFGLFLAATVALSFVAAHVVRMLPSAPGPEQSLPANEPTKSPEEVLV